MTIQDDAALLRRAAELLRNPKVKMQTLEASCGGVFVGYTVSAEVEDLQERIDLQAALESLAARLEGCVPERDTIDTSDPYLEGLRDGHNNCRGEFLNKLEGRE